jgi:hypothetical protein
MKDTHLVGQYADLDQLISRLTEIRNSIPAENECRVEVLSHFGNSAIHVEEFRPMTELEIARHEEYSRRGEVDAKEMRRKRFLALKEEFEPQVQQKEAA